MGGSAMMRKWLAPALLAGAMMTAAPAGLAEGGSLVGSWRALANIGGAPVEFDLVVQPNGAFSETQRSGSMMTMQTGEVQQAGAGMVIFVVEDWQPKSMPSYSSDPAARRVIQWHPLPTG